MASDEPIAEAPVDVSGNGQISPAPIGAGFNSLIDQIETALALDEGLRVVGIETKDKNAPSEWVLGTSRPPVKVGKKNGFTNLAGDFIEVNV